MKNKSYCPLPFNHLAIRPNGNVYPCCAFRWEHVPTDFNIQHPDVFNHPFLQDIRDKMLNDVLVEGCSKCYESERNTTSSNRLHFIKKGSEYGLNMDPYAEPSLIYLDLALSNTCNNKCRMCNPELSTSWYSDAKALGMKIPKGIVEQTVVLENYDLSKLKFIKLIGGEPLMDQAKFINVLNRCNRQDLTILLTTNATLIPNDELTSLMKECNTRVNLSIDSLGSMNDFLRKGSKWETTLETVKWFYANFENNLSVNAVISIYNMNLIEDFYVFFKENFPKISVDFSIVDGPEWMRPRHLPIAFKDIIRQKIAVWKTKFNTPLFNTMLSELANPGNVDTFIKQDKVMNDLRREHWKDANPELYEMVKGYYE